MPQPNSPRIVGAFLFVRYDEGQLLHMEAAMLDRTKKVIPLATWSIERRGRYWHIIKPAFFTDPEVIKGPFSTLLSACLSIGRELYKEAGRHT